MTSGYTREQLAQLWREFEDNAPPLPTDADKKDAPRVSGMRVSGTEFGIIVNFAFKKGETLMVQFNAVVAKELAGGINEAGQHLGWQKKGMVPAPSDHIGQPEPKDLPTALVISALSTYSLPSGMLVNVFLPQMGDAGAQMVWFFPRSIALELLTYVVQAAETAHWWTPDFEIIPIDPKH